MANTGSYSMCMRGTDEAIEELRALLNSDAFPSIYGCDNFGFDEPNRFNGEFNGSFLNSVDIRDELSNVRIRLRICEAHARMSPPVATIRGYARFAH